MQSVRAAPYVLLKVLRNNLIVEDGKGASTALRALMCRPEWFEVSYTINTFMEGNCGKVDRDLARRQWDGLYQALLDAGVLVELIEPQRQPDFVFTANAGLLWNHTVIPARFLHSERKGEEPFYGAWFRARGYDVVEVPVNESFEGEGDVVVREDLLFMGCGSRTSLGARSTLEKVTGLPVVPLQLNPHGFYHLDTCMVSQGKDGALFYYPGAFVQRDLEVIEARIHSSKRIPVSEEEAVCFACNMVICEDTAIFPTAPPSFHDKVRSAGLKPVAVELSEFLKAGGAAKCLTLWVRKA